MELGGEPPRAAPTRGASAKRRWIIAALIVGVCAIATVAFCGGEESPIVWEDDPAYRRWPVVVWATAEGVAERNAEQSDSIRAEREWLIAASSGEAVAGRNGRATAWNSPAGAIRVANNAGLVWIVASNEQRIADELTARIFELKGRWSPPNAGE